MTYADEVQSIKAHGIPRTEYRYEPKHLTALEKCYAPNMMLIHQGERDKVEQILPRFPANTEYLRGYKAPGAYYLTEIQDETAERNHFLITLIHRKTEEEKLVDLLTDADGLSRIRNILNCHFDWNWGIFEVLDLEEPF